MMTLIERAQGRARRAELLCEYGADGRPPAAARPLRAIGYAPRPLQAELHGNAARFKLVVAHRRFGKTVFAVSELLRQALRCRLPAPRLAYVAPFYRQAKAVAWDYLKQQARAVEGASFNETELRCDLPGGARVSLYGADDPDSLRGLYLDGVVLDEYAQMDPRAWSEVIRPALADRLGWALFIGTPLGRNNFWRLYEEAKADPAWHARLFRASETGILPADELAAAKKAMSEAEYAQEFECSFDAAIRGAYYGALIGQAEAEKRVREVPVDPALPVNTAWDLGFGDATAIWFYQLAGRELRLVDYLEASGVGLDHYARELQRRGYRYGEHHLPHDARTPEMGTGKTRLETLQGLGIWARVLNAHRVPDGINEVRKLLPRCWFDAAKCARGLEALRHYRSAWNPRRQVFEDEPLHDWASHGADAFRYLAMALQREPDRPIPKIRYDDRGIV